ncbi:hypothetical protein ACQ5SO_03205 [Rhodovulum sp. DZ06]|uniref:hypothetical protein n=1 Tax=Rhodovulum sp. DZ06 TaxID=3425126 RepID=UPI003D32E9C4
MGVVARILVVAVFALMVGMAWRLADAGVWGEDSDVTQSVRSGSGGGGYLAGRVK